MVLDQGVRPARRVVDRTEVRRRRIIPKDIVAKESNLNLYYIWQDENTTSGTYHAAIVAAESTEEAVAIHPCGDWDRVDMWCYDEETVNARLVGTAAETVPSGLVLTSTS